MFRINDTFSTSDHMDAGVAFLLRVKSEKYAAATEWYTLDGRRLSGKPSQKGIYIYQGKKVIK